MTGNDSMADGESQSGPLPHGFGRKEWIEQLFEMLRLDPGAIVGYRDGNPGAQPPRIDLDPSSFLAAGALDGLQGIDQEIEKDLANLVGHALDSVHVVDLNR